MTESWTPPGGAATRLVLVRHGATEHSALRRFSGRNDLPLDGTGRAQAAALAAAELGAVDVVVSSPLRRARQTADAIATARGLPVTTIDELAELDFGAWEGLTAAEVAQRAPDAFAAWRADPGVAPPAGESFEALEVRVLGAVEALVTAHPGRVIVVVSHVTPIKVVLRRALDASPRMMFRLHLDTASVSVVDRPGGGWSVRTVNDTSQLRTPDAGGSFTSI